jgi:hypothetical protein
MYTPWSDAAAVGVGAPPAVDAPHMEGRALSIQSISRATRLACGTAVTGLACAAMLALTPAQIQAAPKENLFLKYHMRASGMRLATLRFEIEFTAKGYEVHSSMKTKGLLNFIASTKFKASVVGALRRFKPMPVRYEMKTESLWKGDRTHTMEWSGNGAPKITRSWQLGDFKTQALKNTIRGDMPDPLTALLTASFQKPDELCRDKFRVNDGKTVYDLVYSYLERDDFDGENPGVYRGEAHKCVISYRPVAGLSVKKWQKLEKKPNKGREAFTVWMAPVMAKNVNRKVYVPVGGQAQMDGRQINALLVSAALSGNPLNEISLTAQK